MCPRIINRSSKYVLCNESSQSLTKLTVCCCVENSPFGEITKFICKALRVYFSNWLITSIRKPNRQERRERERKIIMPKTRTVQTVPNLDTQKTYKYIFYPHQQKPKSGVPNLVCFLMRCYHLLHDVAHPFPLNIVVIALYL